MVSFFPEALLLSEERSSQIMCEPRGAERPGQREFNQKCVDSRHEAVSYPHGFFSPPRCWYSREVALILPSRLVTHTWVITCGWEWALWSVLPCCFSPSSAPNSATVVSGQITSHVIALFLFWIAADNLPLTGNGALYTSRITFETDTVKLLPLLSLQRSPETIRAPSRITVISDHIDGSR